MPPRKRKSAPRDTEAPAARQDPATSEISVLSLRYEPAAIAQILDVTRLHSILRSAESGDVRDLMALYRDIIAQDSHLQAEFAKRKMAVVGDSMELAPADPKSAIDVATRDLIVANISECDGWRLALAHLMDSTLYPVSLVEKIYRPSGLACPSFTLARLVHVPHHLLDFTTGKLRLYDVDQQTGALLSTTQAPDPNRYIIHRGHILTTPDNWGGPMRSILFWWLLSTMSREWWARFLDRYGHPFLVGSYPRGDRDAKSVLERAFALSVRLGGLVVSDGTRVELKEASTTATGDAYERFISLCNREKSKLVIGQTLSAEAAPTGLGSGVSQQQELVRQDIRAFDAQLLADSLRDQLFDQIAAINGAAGMLPKQSFGRDIALTADRTTKTLTALRSTDFEPDDSATPPLSAALGITLRRRAVSAVPSPFSAYVARLERGV